MEAFIRKPTRPSPVFNPPQPKKQKTQHDEIEELGAQQNLRTAINSLNSDPHIAHENIIKDLNLSESEIEDECDLPILKAILAREDNQVCEELKVIDPPQCTSIDVGGVEIFKNKEPERIYDTLSSSGESTSDVSITPDKKKCHTKGKKERSAIVISPLRRLERSMHGYKIPCIYVLKKGPRKGKSCDIPSTGKFCFKHVKPSPSSNSNKIIQAAVKTDNMEMKIQIEKFEKSITDLKTKFQHQNEAWKNEFIKINQENQEIKEKIGKMNKLVEEQQQQIGILTNQLAINPKIKQFTLRKIQKLNKMEMYKLVDYSDKSQEAILSGEGRNWQVKIPKTLMPTPVKGTILSYDQDKNMFDWSK